MTDGRIEARFEAQALARPDAIALSSAEGDITYGELDRLSAYYAALLAAAGGSGDVVAILAERGPRFVVAMLACARAGRPFVVLDRAYPPARLDALVAIARPTQLLLAAEPATGQDFNLPATQIALDPPPAAAGRPTRVAGSPEDVAYLLFTSGSTGAPKCVAVSHRPLVNFVDWQARTFGLTADDRFTLLSGLSHDPVLRDVFTPLSLGATLHIPPQATLTEPGGLHAWFAKVRPTAVHMTPQLGHLLTTVRSGAERLHGLRHVFFGGDMLRGELVRAVSALAPGCQCVNFYGATETPQAAAFYRAGPEDEVAPIGEGIDGFTLEIRGANGRSAPAGEAGEIVVQSPFLTLGYVRDGRLPGAREASDTYATGDIGHSRADGQIVIQGRRDDQVKVRGYRVELAEITAAALTHPRVSQAITLNIGDPEAVQLCTFVESMGDGVGAEALRAHIGATLPAYMVPDVVTAVEVMPLLPNGKIDRQALLAGRRKSAPRAAVSASPAEAGLIRSWSGVFRGAEITPASSFAGLGGDSLSYVNAYLSLEEALGHVPTGWTTMSLRDLAALKATEKRSLFTEVESAMVLRALAISTVVASHFGLVYSGGAATSTLFWISGFLFGGLQLHEIDQRKALDPIARLLRSILIPLFAIVGPFMILKAITGHPVHLSSLVLNVDLMDFTGATTEGPDAYGGHDYLMWFVHCMVHMLLIVTGLLLVFQTALKAKDAVLKALVAAVVLGLAARFVLPAFFLADFGRSPVEGLSIFGHSPTAHFATFTLAALTGFLRGRWRNVMLGITAAYVAASIPTYGLLDSLAIGAAATLLAFAPKLRAPRILSLPIYLIAGASLFIYLLHFRFLQVVHEMLGLPTALAFVAAVGGGVAVWGGWNWGTKLAADIWSRLVRPFASARSSAAA